MTEHVQRKEIRTNKNSFQAKTFRNMQLVGSRVLHKIILQAVPVHLKCHNRIRVRKTIPVCITRKAITPNNIAANETENGVSYKNRPARYHKRNIDVTSTKTGILNYLKSRDVYTSDINMILGKTGSLSAQLIFHARRQLSLNSNDSGLDRLFVANRTLNGQIFSIFL